MRRRFTAFILTGLAALMQPTIAGADAPRIVSARPEVIAVTVYRDDLALVTEERTVDLPAGRSTIAFEGVSDRMIPQSALLNDFGAITIERNFDFDLLSPATFFAKSLGETLILTRTNRATGRVTREEARIVSASAENGVVLDSGGRIEAYQCAGVAESLSAAQLPAGLLAHPTLSLEVSAEEAGPQRLAISYLASGYSWLADYVLTLDEGGDTARMIGWLTMTNATSIPVENAETAIVAGTLQMTGDSYAPETSADYFFARCWPRGSTKTGTYKDAGRGAGAVRRQDRLERAAAMAAPEAAYADEAIIVTGSRIARREELGDYQLYRTPEPTTLAPMQTKQILFLERAGVGVGKRYVYEARTPRDFESDAPLPAGIQYRIDNSRAGALAEPLPAGTVRVMTKHGDGAFFLGEARVDDLAVDLPVKVNAAEAVSVRMTTRLLKEESSEAGDYLRERVTVEHVVTNALDETASIDIVLGKNFSGAIKIDKASRRLARDEALPTFRVTLEPGASETLTYRATWLE